MVRLLLAIGVLPLVLACSAQEQLEDPQVQDNSSDLKAVPEAVEPAELAVSNDLYEFTYQSQPGCAA